MVQHDDAMNSAENRPLVVALGASAGGLESLQTFFQAMPADSGMAFVVIQHLSPDFKSLMNELLAKHTEMSIHRIQDDMPIRQNNVYLIPPKKIVTVSGGTFRLEDRKPGGHELPIDIFFSSLASDMEDRCAAIVLSGTGSDGTNGAQAIHKAGGLVIVQSPESSKFDGMPRSAIAAKLADAVMSPEYMPELLLEYQADPEEVRKSLSAPSGPEAGADAVATVFTLLKNAYGIDFSQYKPSTVGRRLERRMTMRQLQDPSDYLALVGSDNEELNALYRDLLIGVTSFFRDAKAFEKLETEGIPSLFENADGQEEIRAWVAGCASGEEAYSVAILLVEAAEKYGYEGKVSVFATDAHKASLDFASAGIYDTSRLSNVSPARLSRFFREEGEDVRRVSPELRQRIVFARHNVISDPPFTKMDLVTCRNLLIYLHPRAQDKALGMFHFSLKMGGVLFLGSSESPGSLADEFAVISQKSKLFKKVRETKLALDFSLARTERDRAPAAQILLRDTDRKLMADYDYLLKQHMPPGFLLNEKREIVHVFGNAGRFLTNLEGRIGRDVLDMLDGNLRLALGAALQRSASSSAPIIYNNIELSGGDPAERVDLTVESLHQERPSLSRYHVSITPSRRPALPRVDTQDITPDASFVADDVARSRIAVLEEELQSTRENLQATIEELQTTNEEMQATNEEMLASNEELQSTNEELHSVNEELFTVNAEFEKKNKELQDLNDDYDNLLRSTEVGTLFLDEELRIRRFNKAIALTFNLLPHDIGRPVSHIAYNLDGREAMLESLQGVLDGGDPVEKEVQTKDGAWLLKRVLPFVQSDGRHKGVVVTFTDITFVKQMERERMKDQTLREIAASVPGAVFQLESDPDGSSRFTFLSERSSELFGVPNETLLKDPQRLLSMLKINDLDNWTETTPGNPGIGDFFETECLVELPEGTQRWIHTRCTPIRHEADRLALNGVCIDVTSRRINEERVERAARQQKMILDNAPVLIWQSDTEGRHTWFNATWLEFTGKTLEQEIDGGWTEGVHPDDLKRYLSAYDEAFHARQVFSMDFQLRRKDGQYRWLTEVGTPLEDLDGVFSGYIGYCFDMTERAEAQDSLKQAVDMMVNTNKLKSEFLASMSHEIRTPLNGVLGMLQLVSRTALDDEQKEYIEAANFSGNNLLRLINDILDLSKIEAGKVELREENFDLCTLLKLACKTFESEVAQKGLKLLVDYPPECPLFLKGDPSRINQILYNVLGNAVKFTRQGTVSISASVSSFKTNRDECRIAFEVADTGIGIPEDKLESIFEPFIQARNQQSRENVGTGLGLSIVRRLARLMGGDISIHSELGKGTRVSFHAMAKMGEGKVVTEKDDSHTSCAALNVLVVEDEAINQRLMTMLFRKSPHEATIVDDSDDIEQLIADNDFDLILMDVQLGTCTGMDITRIIRESKKLGPKSRIPIIALTAFAMEGDREKFLSSGMDDYVAKPLNWDDLEDKMCKIIHKRPN